jgi:fructose-1,6-bisphosphatase/inositol monophosphatase family enzyme
VSVPRRRPYIGEGNAISGGASLGELNELAFARLLADAADRISLDLYQGAELLVITKPGQAEGSEADLAVEAALRRLLHTHRPEQGVLGGQRGAEGSQRVRLNGPIDATRNFVRGLDWWATLLALEVNGRTEVAMISAPAMGRRRRATCGQGAWTTGPVDPEPRPLPVSGVAELADAYLVYGDLAAPMLLVTEAGVMLTDPAGQPWNEGQLAVAGNRLLHPAVLVAMPEPGGRDPHAAETAAANPPQSHRDTHPRRQPKRWPGSTCAKPPHRP